MEEKICSKCKNLLPIEQFHFRNKKAGTRQSKCIQCSKEESHKRFVRVDRKCLRCKQRKLIDQFPEKDKSKREWFYCADCIANPKKMCGRCKRLLPLDKFNLTSKGDRYESWCVSCINNYTREWNKSETGRVSRRITMQHYRQTHMEQRRIRDRKHYRDHRNYIIDLLIERYGVDGKWICKECHKEFQFYQIDFHHRDKNEKDYALWEVMMSRGDFKRHFVELDKCDIYCARCHNNLMTDINLPYAATDKQGDRGERKDQNVALILEKEIVSKCILCQDDLKPKEWIWHHIHSKKYEVSGILRDDFDKVWKEIQKCVLLCKNCHRTVHNEVEANDKIIAYYWTNLVGGVYSSLYMFRKDYYDKSQDKVKDLLLDVAVRVFSAIPMPTNRLGFTLEHVWGDIVALCNSGIATINSKMIKGGSGGLKALNWFFPNRFKAHQYHRKSPHEAWNDPQLLRMGIEMQLRVYGDATPNRTRNTLERTSKTHGVTNFKPSVVSRIVSDYCPENGTYVDFSAGYGARMMGTMVLNRGITYIGVDPNVETCANLNKLHEFLLQRYPNNKAFIHCMPFEDVDLSMYSGNVDLCFSSPPYFCLEHYCDSGDQSYTRYTEYGDWLKGFMFPTIDKCHDLLKPGGKFIINVADVTVRGNRYRLDHDVVTYAMRSFFLIDTYYMSMMRMMGIYGKDKGADKMEPIFVFQKK